MTDTSQVLTQDTIVSWMGKNIEDLDKEELLDVVKQLGRQLKREKDNHQATLNMWLLCRKAKR